jgi:hypothetical protein
MIPKLTLLAKIPVVSDFLDLRASRSPSKTPWMDTLWAVVPSVVAAALAARGNSKCFRKTPSAQKNLGAERRYNAFLPHGWTFRYPPKSALESLSGAEPTFTTGC